MNAPIKVLHVIPSIGLARGGPSVVIRTLAQAQAERGIQVHVAATDDDGPGRRTAPASVPFVESNVTYWVFPRQTRFYLFSLPLTRWLRQHAADYDVVHIHALFSYSSVAAAATAAMACVPYIVRPLGTLSSWSMRNRRRWIKRLSYRFLESRIVRGAAAVHFTCDQEALEAHQLGTGHHRVVIPNPVNSQTDHSTVASAALKKQGGKVILFLSRLDPKKGLDLLLPAFAKLRTSIPDAILVIAGDGEREFVNGLKQRAAALDLGPAVQWPGFLQGDQKRAAFADAVVFVLPSYSENFGVAAVEAMAAGLPVVISDQVGIHLEVQAAQAGLVCRCTDNDLAAALIEGLSDPLRLRKMGENAVQLASTFSPEAIARRLEELYLEITQKRPESRAA